jgi:hypothetical protein
VVSRVSVTSGNAACTAARRCASTPDANGLTMRSWLTRPDHDAQLDALSQPPTIRFVLTRVPPLWVFAGLVALQVLYVLTFDPFITVDAAAHIGSSA